MDSNKENIIKIADDILNYSIDSLVGGNVGLHQYQLTGQEQLKTQNTGDNQDEKHDDDQVRESEKLNDDTSQTNLTFSESPLITSFGPALVSADSVESQKQQQIAKTPRTPLMPIGGSAKTIESIHSALTGTFDSPEFVDKLVDITPKTIGDMGDEIEENIVNNSENKHQEEHKQETIETGEKQEREDKEVVKFDEPKETERQEIKTEVVETVLIREESLELIKQPDSIIEQENTNQELEKFESEVSDLNKDQDQNKEEDFYLENNNNNNNTTDQDNSKIITDDNQKNLNTNLKQDNAHISFQTAIGHNSIISDFEEEDEEKQQQPQETEIEEQEKVLKQEELIRKEFNQKQEETPRTMEFTKNYSDDLLMGQNENNQGRTADIPASGVDLADFELPPYSGSSSGSEPRQNSPVNRKSSSSISAQPSSSQQQQTSVGFKGIKNLLITSYSRTSHVLQWKKPIETGIYFSIGLTLITALTFFSIISVVAYSALGIIMTSGSIKVYKSIMQTLNKSPETPFDHVWDKVQSMNVSISSEKIHELIDVSLGNLNSSLVYLKQVLLFEDKIATIKFGCYFYLLTYIGSWFNGMTLITLTYLAIFSLPIAYEKNKSQIDQYFNLIHGHICATTNKVTSMIFGPSKAATTSSTTSKKQN